MLAKSTTPFDCHSYEQTAGCGVGGQEEEEEEACLWYIVRNEVERCAKQNNILAITEAT